MTVSGARQEEFCGWKIGSADNLQNGLDHALNADAVHAAEINRALAQKNTANMARRI